jgi:hypothetical protein
LKDEKFFYSFLAGYFDAEGCVGFDVRHSNHTVSLILKSCDYGILRDAYATLADDQYTPTTLLDKMAGEQGLNSDLWVLRIGRRASVLRLLNKMPLRHSEKVAKSNLVKSIASSGWRDGWKDVGLPRTSIAADVRRFKREAQDALATTRQPHSA